MLRIVDIAFEPFKFAERIQHLLVEDVTALSESTGSWFRDNWTGRRGRYCLCHSTHGGTNNNMGVEVDWRDVKKICPPSSNLGTFLGAMFHFIKEIGKEHMEHLIKTGAPNAFKRSPVISQAIFDLMQDMHPKTLACTMLLDTTGKEKDKKFFERVHQIMALCEGTTPIHLKIQAWHRNNKKFGVSQGPPRLENFKELLMLRQNILKAIDPDFTKSTDELLAHLTPLARLNEQYVLNNE